MKHFDGSPRRPLRVLFPKHIDRIQSPMSVLMLAIVEANPDLQFYSFSSPETGEDREAEARIWHWPQLTRLSPAAAALQRFDIVHHASAGLANYVLSRWARLRGQGRTHHVFTANCEPYPTHPRRALLLRCVEHADVVISVSKAVAVGFERELRRQSDAIVPNGFDPRFYRPAEDATSVRYPEGVRGPYALFSSTLIDRKRPDVVLALARRLPEIEFVMVGGWVDPIWGRRIRSEAGCLPNVHIQGAIERRRLRDYMQAATMLLHPSEYEGLPLSVIEALGTGLPVIAQPSSSLPEIIRDNWNGWLIPAQDLDAWAARIRDIFAWPAAKRQSHALIVREDAIKRFSWDSIGRQYGTIYRTVVRGD